MSKQNINNEDENLSKDAPFLFGLKKEEPYSAPDGYFEKFQLEIQDKIHLKKSSWWNIILKPIVWAPAMVILIVSGMFIFKGDSAIENESTYTNVSTFTLNEISYEVLDLYVNENLLADANTDELVEIVGAENIPSLGTASESSVANKDITPMIEHVEEQEMEEYIMENIDDIEVY